MFLPAIINELASVFIVPSTCMLVAFYPDALVEWNSSTLLLASVSDFSLDVSAFFLDASVLDFADVLLSLSVTVAAVFSSVWGRPVSVISLATLCCFTSWDISAGMSVGAAPASFFLLLPVFLSLLAMVVVTVMGKLTILNAARVQVC